MDITKRSGKKSAAAKIPTVDELMKGVETRFVLVGTTLRDAQMSRAEWLELPSSTKDAMLRVTAESLIEQIAARVGL